MSPLGGMYMEVRDNIWPRAKEGDVLPFWEFCRGIKVFNISKEIPEMLDIYAQTKRIHDMGYGLPSVYGVVGDGDHVFCFNKDIKIIRLNSERIKWLPKIKPVKRILVFQEEVEAVF